jgi:hypothetical protein
MCVLHYCMHRNSFQWVLVVSAAALIVGQQRKRSYA